MFIMVCLCFSTGCSLVCQHDVSRIPSMLTGPLIARHPLTRCSSRAFGQLKRCSSYSDSLEIKDASNTKVWSSQACQFPGLRRSRSFGTFGHMQVNTLDGAVRVGFSADPSSFIMRCTELKEVLERIQHSSRGTEFSRVVERMMSALRTAENRVSIAEQVAAMDFLKAIPPSDFPTVLRGSIALCHDVSLLESLLDSRREAARLVEAQSNRIVLDPLFRRDMLKVEAETARMTNISSLWRSVAAALTTSTGPRFLITELSGLGLSSEVECEGVPSHLKWLALEALSASASCVSVKAARSDLTDPFAPPPVIKVQLSQTEEGAFVKICAKGCEFISSRKSLEAELVHAENRKFVHPADLEGEDDRRPGCVSSGHSLESFEIVQKAASAVGVDFFRLGSSIALEFRRPGAEKSVLKASKEREENIRKNMRC